MPLQQLDINRFEEIIYDNCESCMVVFTRKNCHICSEVLPMLEDLHSQYNSTLGFYYVDVEESVNLSQRFSLKGVPSVIFFSDGELKGKLAGQMEEEQVEEKIAAIFSS